MSINRNIFANYVSRIYITIIGIALLPLYIKYMGAEAYGLVGFYAMLQAWFSLLDIGLTPTTSRETSRYHGGALAPVAYRQFLRAMEGVFLVVAICGGSTLFVGSNFISTNWLQASQIHVDELKLVIQIMAFIIAARWMCGLYRGVITGSEKLILLSWYTSAIATLRFVGVLPVLIFVSATPTSFFSFQLVVAVIEFLGYVFLSYRLLPKISNLNRLSWSYKPLLPTLKFSLTIAFTTSAWILLTQIDKLVLSKILPLDDYGYFTLAVIAAGSVLLVGGPVSLALMPAMARLEAENKQSQVVRIYRKATQFVSVVAGSAAITLGFFAEPILWAWTGDVQLAKQTAPIMSLYAVGNGILAVSAFPYYLQYAKGDLRLHLIGNVIFMIIFLPLVYWIAGQFGGVGAGCVWAGMNAVLFVFWLPFVHHKFEPGLNRQWFTKDTLAIFLPTLLVGYLLRDSISIVTNGRFFVVVEVMAIGLAILFTASLASSEARATSVGFIKRKSSKQG